MDPEAHARTQFAGRARQEKAIWRRARPAVARLVVPIPGTSEDSRGTAFLLAPDLALTALHVVADRTENPPKVFAERLQLQFPSGSIHASIVQGGLSLEEDWAVLRLEAKVPAVPLPFASPETLAEGSRGDAFDTFGFPETAPKAGKAAVGAVRYFEPGNDKVRSHLQLYCEDAAAGNGEPVQGLSGAPVVVDDAVVGFLRSALLDAEGGNVAGALYACPITCVLDAPAVESLALSTVDPLRGLPGLPRCDLPSTTFRDLRPYGNSDAEVFFGRGRDIRALFEIVSAEGEAPIVLVYGQSGVGKSSLLEAGLFPRLGWTYCVCGARRNGSVGLAGTLSEILNTSELNTAADIANAWRSIEAQSQQPVLVWIDQVDEAWTRARNTMEADSGAEFTRLLECCEALFGPTARRPRGKLLLSFRKEFLSEIEILLERCQLPFIRWFVEPMSRDSVAEVVLGPTSTDRLRRQYGLSVEPGLEQTVAERVCADTQSPVAPTLQIFMTRLWAAAKANGQRLPSFDRNLLSAIEERSDYLADFLDRQLDTVARHHPDDEISGLLLDLLAYHTSVAASAEERTREAIYTTYKQLNPPHLDILLTALVTARLLADSGDQRSSSIIIERRTRLIHDTLAPRVRARFDQSIRPGQRARRILEARGQVPAMSVDATHVGAAESVAILTREDLKIVQDGRAGMRAWTVHEEGIVRATEAAQSAAAAEQQAVRDTVNRETGRRKQAERNVRNALASVAVLLLLGVVGGLGLWISEKQQAIARSRSLAESLFVSAEGDTAAPLNITRALLGTAKAIEVAPTDWPRRDMYIARAAHLAQLSSSGVASLGGELLTATISRDGLQILIIRDGGGAELRRVEGGALIRRLGPDVGPTGGRQLMAPAINTNGTTAAALMPANDANGGTFVVAWDCTSGAEWLRASLPHELAAFPDRIFLDVTEDGWVIARIEALPYDLGGTPTWTSSALALGWHRDQALTATDRSPDATWDAHGTSGALAPAPVGPGRLAFVPERGTKNQPAVGEQNAVELATPSVGTTRPLDGWPKELTSLEAVKGIAWSPDGEQVVIIANSAPTQGSFGLWAYKDAPGEHLRLLGAAQVKDASIAAVSSSTILIAAPAMQKESARFLAWPTTPSHAISDDSGVPSVTLPISQLRQYVSLGPEGQSIVTISDNVIRVVDFRGGGLLKPPVQVAGEVVAARVIDAGRTLITITKDGILQKWNLEPDLRGIKTDFALPQLGDSGKTSEPDAIVNASFSSDLSELALVKKQSNDVFVVAIPNGDPAKGFGTVKRMPISELLAHGSEEFRNLHALGIDSNGRIAFAAQTIIGQVREQFVANGQKPCSLALPPTEAFATFAGDTTSAVTCSARGCQRWSTSTCSTNDPDVGLIPIGTLNKDLLASAIAISQGVVRTSERPLTIELEFGAEKWHSTAPVGAASRVVWVDPKTGLQVVTPRARSSGATTVIRAVSGDGRTYGVEEFGRDDTGTLRWAFGARDASTGRPLTLDIVGVPHPGQGLVAAAFSPDGQWLYSLNSNGTLSRQWVLGSTHSSAWVTGMAGALTGYRLVGVKLP